MGHAGSRAAFSLVELSIVLVILGLLTGGILSGQSLIRAAAMRAVVTESQNYQTAGMTFRDKYLASAGDMRNATRFWGDNNTACPDAAITNGTPGTCNGNGDGDIGSGLAANTSYEEYQAWNQMALAGLVEGSYSGLSNAAGNPAPSVNTPTSKLGSAYWRVRWFDVSGTVTGTLVNTFAVDKGNALELTSDNGLILSPEETWNIDTKIDDGKPARGKAIARPWDSNCTTAANRTDLDAEYMLTIRSPECMLYFKDAF